MDFGIFGSQENTRWNLGLFRSVKVWKFLGEIVLLAYKTVRIVTDELLGRATDKFAK